MTSDPKILLQPPAKYRYAAYGIGAEPPDNPETSIWRYMSLDKFESLLTRQALFMCRADGFDGDKWEGAINKEWLDHRTRIDAKFKKKKLHRYSPALIETQIVNTLINCWHINEVESAGMWDWYAKDGGIAVRSTYQRLIDSLPRDSSEQSYNADGTDLWIDINVGLVKYIDYEDDGISIDNPMFHKRREFSHERELRIVALDQSFRREPRPSRFPRGGDFLPVTLETLIQSIVVSPNAPKSLAAKVNLLLERSAVKFKIEKSKLAEEPYH